jgi:hypothetical protein
MSTPIENNTVGLEDILQIVRELPEPGASGGGSGIYIGEEEPTDGSSVWIDTDENAPGGSFATADWNAEKGQLGHVLNRTHWKETERKVILDETFTTSAGMANSYQSLNLEVGQTYTVTFMGQQYSCVCEYARMQGMGGLCLGNPLIYGGENNGLPFAVGYVLAMNMVVLGVLQDGSYSVKIEGDVNTYHKIPTVFLPSPVFIIDLDMYEPRTDVTQIELNRAIDEKRLVAVRISYPGNGVVVMCHFSWRSQEGVITFAAAHSHLTGGTINGNYSIDLIPNDSGGYDVSEE